MRRMAAVLAMVLGCTFLAVAQDKGDMTAGKGTEMTGILCNAKCVKQDSGKASCDSNCTANGDDVVFIDDQGKATKVANPKMTKGKMGKKVKVRGEMMKDKDEMEIYDVLSTVGG
jgi:hypothetical protein